MMAVIETEKLTKRYGGDRGILDLDLVVGQGEVFGFLGPNGAGKTTTIRLLLDMIRPTSGSVRLLGGLDMRRDSLSIRRRTGYLPGELSLYGRLTGEETLRYYANLRGGVDQRYVDELADRLDCELQRRNDELSSGNRRKLGLIQALMHRPELLILDEPTSGLDPLVQHEFYRLIGEVRAAGQSVFLSSHVLPEVQRICDRVAFIRKARLVAVESVDDLFGRAVRQVEVVFATDAPGDRIQAVPGVTVLGQAGVNLRLSVSGSVDPLLKALAGHEVVDLVSREPDLDDVFMTYYGDEGPGDDAGRGPDAQ
jgi:ABC-2 type transport system ATP-binding protein